MKVSLSVSINLPGRFVFSKIGKEPSFMVQLPCVAVTLCRFDGSQIGQWIVVETGSPVSGTWRFLMVERLDTDGMSYLILRAREAPSPIKEWNHAQRVEETIGGCRIIDELCYSTCSMLLDLFIWPQLKIMLLFRRKAYKKYFSGLGRLRQE